MLPESSPPDPHPSIEPAAGDAGCGAGPTPPPAFSKQMAQLVIIPALIVIAAVGLAALFGKLAGAQESIDSHLSRLRQSSGAGVMAGGIQDPRYKDRGLAAYNIAAMIPAIKDPAEQQRLSDALVDILEKNVTPDEEHLQVYLLSAVGRLAQPGGLKPILHRFDAPRAPVRQGAVAGTLGYAAALQERGNAEAAVQLQILRTLALPRLRGALDDPSAEVRAGAAAALGHLASPGDEDTRLALRTALEGGRIEYRESQWNAAVALARLGDPMGSDVVARVLLDREALGRLPAAASGPHSQVAMPPDLQGRIIMATLASAPAMNDAAVWYKIAELSKRDPSLAVQKAARELMLNRQREPERAADPSGPQVDVESPR